MEPGQHTPPFRRVRCPLPLDRSGQDEEAVLPGDADHRGLGHRLDHDHLLRGQRQDGGGPRNELQHSGGDTAAADQVLLPVERQPRTVLHDQLRLSDLLRALLDDPLQPLRRDVLLLADLRLRAATASEGHHEAPHGAVCLAGHLQTQLGGPVQVLIGQLQVGAHS